MRILTLGVLMLVGLAAHSAIAATTLEELLADGQLSAEVVVDTPPPLYQRAPIVLAVEVATPRWFSRGTRVRDFRVPGALVRPVSNFADNQSRRIDGDSWSVQRWRFRLFAQNPGPLSLPPLRVFVSVSTADHGVVDGELQLQPPVIKTIAPPGTENLESWVAASSLRIDERWDGELESYVAGDALTRHREFLIEDAPAMVIPGAADTQIEGLSVYTAPAEVADRSDRGRLSGVRRERQVFTFEQPGTYTLPGASYAWFNTRTATIETIALPERVVVVGTGAEQADTAGADSSRATLPWQVIAALIVFATGLVLLARSRVGEFIARGIRRLRERWKRERAFARALREGDSQRILALLYQRLDTTSHNQLVTAFAAMPRERATCEQLMAHAYGNGEAPQKAEIRKLWKNLGAASPAPTAGRSLSLNPAPSAAAARSR